MTSSGCEGCPTIELLIVNLEPSDCALCPTFVMVDFAELTYRVRP
jgi:hypothetical protein